MTSWDSSGVELLIKLVAGLETIPSGDFKFEPRMTYSSGDFTWPDEVSSRTGATVTVYRQPTCTTGAILDTVTGDIGYDPGDGFNLLDGLLTTTIGGPESGVSESDVVKPTIIVTFTR